MIRRALFLMTSKDSLTLKDGSRHRTGFYANEFLEPYDLFRQAGLEVEIGTPDGGLPKVDPASVDPRQLGEARARELRQGLDRAGELKAPRKLSEIQASDYDLIFVPGGHAPAEDLPYDPDVKRLLNHAQRSGTLVAALCHGPVALLAGLDSGGRWLYSGKQVTGFSEAEEALTPVAGKLKWELESALREQGGLYSRAGSLFEGYVVQDGSLVTGENPNSATLLGRKVLAVLEHGTEGRSVSLSVHRDLAAPPDVVWGAIGRFDALPWHPGIASGTASGGRRSLVAHGGSPAFQEELLETGERELRYRMVEGLPVQPVATLRVEPTEAGGSRIVWEADVDTSKLDAATAVAVTQGITRFYEQGLTALQERFTKSAAPEIPSR